MKKETAAAILKITLRQGAELDSMLAEVRDELTVEEFDDLRRSVASIMGTALVDIMNPIFAAHPDLVPPELKGHVPPPIVNDE